MSILVFIEHKTGTLNKSSLEAIAAAQKLGADIGQKVSAVLMGSRPLADEIAVYDLEKVMSAESEKLADYTPDAYADALEKVVRATNPEYVIMSHTYQARDFAPKVAARFQKGLIGDCIRMNLEGGKRVFTRRVFLGKLDADVAVVQIAQCGQCVADSFVARVVIAGEPLASGIQVGFVARLIPREEREPRTDQAQLQVLPQEKRL